MQPKLKKATVDKLKKLCRIIRKYPTQIEMDYWFYHSPSGAIGRCKTAGCLAGIAVTLKRSRGFHPLKVARRYAPAFATTPSLSDWVAGWSSGATGIRGDARKFLGLTVEQSDMLFIPGNWPEPFRGNLRNASRTKRRIKDNLRSASRTRERKAYAQVVIDRVNFFIATGGTDRESLY